MNTRWGFVRASCALVLLSHVTGCLDSSFLPGSGGDAATPVDSVRLCALTSQCGTNERCEQVGVSRYCVPIPSAPDARVVEQDRAPSPDVAPPEDIGTSADVIEIEDVSASPDVATPVDADIDAATPVDATVSSDTATSDASAMTDGSATDVTSDTGPDTRPRWTLRVVSARVTRCDTNWDLCMVAPPLCTPSLPDLVVRIAGRETPEASNRCTTAYNTVVGEYRADQLAAGLRAELIDGDLTVSGSLVGDTICGPFSVTFDAADLTAGRKTATCSGGEVGFTLTPVPMP